MFHDLTRDVAEGRELGAALAVAVSAQAAQGHPTSAAGLILFGDPCLAIGPRVP